MTWNLTSVTHTKSNELTASKQRLSLAAPTPATACGLLTRTLLKLKRHCPTVPLPLADVCAPYSVPVVPPTPAAALRWRPRASSVEVNGWCWGLAAAASRTGAAGGGTEVQKILYPPCTWGMASLLSSMILQHWKTLPTRVWSVVGWEPWLWVCRMTSEAKQE